MPVCDQLKYKLHFLDKTETSRHIKSKSNRNQIQMTLSSTVPPSNWNVHMDWNRKNLSFVNIIKERKEKVQKLIGNDNECSTYRSISCAFTRHPKQITPCIKRHHKLHSRRTQLHRGVMQATKTSPNIKCKLIKLNSQLNSKNLVNKIEALEKGIDSNTKKRTIPRSWSEKSSCHRRKLAE